MIQKILKVSLCLALIFAVVPPADAAAVQPAPGVRLGLTSPLNQLDPMFIQNNSEAVLAGQLFLGLTGIDEMESLCLNWRIAGKCQMMA
jgi:hypothetical protein